jgi:YggT family protein
MNYLITFINWFFQVLIIMVILDVVISYFLPPEHPVRSLLDRFFEPLLAPIHKILPQTGMVDFSPVILMIVFILIRYILVAIISSF